VIKSVPVAGYFGANYQATQQHKGAVDVIFQSHPVFPTPDIKATAAYYRDVLGFRSVEYLNLAEPHICLYRDDVEIILTSATRKIHPNRELYGYGYDV
jgi:hypothetical protein